MRLRLALSDISQYQDMNDYSAYPSRNREVFWGNLTLINAEFMLWGLLVSFKFLGLVKITHESFNSVMLFF